MPCLYPVPFSPLTQRHAGAVTTVRTIAVSAWRLWMSSQGRPFDQCLNEIGAFSIHHQWMRPISNLWIGVSAPTCNRCLLPIPSSALVVLLIPQAGSLRSSADAHLIAPVNRRISRLVNVPVWRFPNNTSVLKNKPPKSWRTFRGFSAASCRIKNLRRSSASPSICIYTECLIRCPLFNLFVALAHRINTCLGRR